MFWRLSASCSDAHVERQASTSVLLIQRIVWWWEGDLNGMGCGESCGIYKRQQSTCALLPRTAECPQAGKETLALQQSISTRRSKLFAQKCVGAFLLNEALVG